MVGNAQAKKSALAVTRFGSNRVAQSADPVAKIYFDVPFEEKEIAKAAGLQWDNAVRKWFACDAEIAIAYTQLADLHVDAATQAERYYFKVPFLRKDRAKAMGMRFDGVRKLWFAPTPELAVDAARVFERIVE